MARQRGGVAAQSLSSLFCCQPEAPNLPTPTQRPIYGPPPSTAKGGDGRGELVARKHGHPLSSSTPQREDIGTGGRKLASAALPPCSPSLSTASVICPPRRLRTRKGLPQVPSGQGMSGLSRSLALVSNPLTWSRGREGQRPLVLHAFF